MLNYEKVFWNAGTNGIVVVVEPWGAEYPVAPGGMLRVVIESQVSGQPETELEGDRKVIWGWVGSTYEAFLNEEKLT